MCIFLSAIVLWLIVVVKSSAYRKESDMIVSYLLDTDCDAARFQVKAARGTPWVFRPRIIITRTTASLVVAVGTAELLVFNAIANYGGEGSVNASSALLILFTGVLFHFFTMTHKYMKSGVSDIRNRLYGVTSSFFLMFAGGIYVCYIAYSDGFGWKSAEGASMLMFYGGLVISAAMFLMCVAPMTEALKPYGGKKNENSTLSLVLSGEYYTSFSVIDCFVIFTPITIFICLETFFISQVRTREYALPFIFLEVIPLYGFSLNVAACFKQNVTLTPSLFNIATFFVMFVSGITSMLHVCAIPGVSTACVGSIAHSVLNTNIFVCGPILVLLFLISIGLVSSTFAPSFLVSGECVSEIRQKPS
jgi:hypothetical protein